MLFNQSVLARRARFWWAMAMVVFSAFLLMPAAVLASTPTTPFTECPKVGADTSCRILIILNSDGTTTILTNSSLGPFDGKEDTLVGVLNQTGVSISHVNLSSTKTIFAFDKDGLCTFVTCSYAHPTGYEGPNTSFSGISSTKKTGTVNFTGGGGSVL